MEDGGRDKVEPIMIIIIQCNTHVIELKITH